MATRLRVLKQRRRRASLKIQSKSVSTFRVPWDEGDWFDYDEDDYGEGDCAFCGGDGWVDGYESDPLWFVPGELERCASCGGSGNAKDMTIW